MISAQIAAIVAWLGASAWAARTMYVTLKDDPDMTRDHGAALPIACFGTALIAWPWVAFVEANIAVHRWLIVRRFRRAMQRVGNECIAEVRANVRAMVRDFEQEIAGIGKK